MLSCPLLDYISRSFLEEGFPHCPLVGMTLSQDPKSITSWRSQGIPSFAFAFPALEKSQWTGPGCHAPLDLCFWKLKQKWLRSIHLPMACRSWGLHNFLPEAWTHRAGQGSSAMSSWHLSSGSAPISRCPPYRLCPPQEYLLLEPRRPRNYKTCQGTKHCWVLNFRAPCHKWMFPSLQLWARLSSQ